MTYKLIYILLLSILVSSSPLHIEEPTNCNASFDGIIGFTESRNGFFGLHGFDRNATGNNLNRAEGRIYLNQDNLTNYNGGSWFINNLEFKNHLSGYGSTSYSNFNKPDFDSLWGRNVAYTLEGNNELNIDKVSGTFYLPKKIIALFEINEREISSDSIEPIPLKRSDSIRLKWDKDNLYRGEVSITISFNMPLDYKVKSNAEYTEVTKGKRWTPDGYVARISRTICINDIGLYEISDRWLQGINRGEVVFLSIKRGNSHVLSNGEYSFNIFSIYEVERSFKMVQ